MSTSPNKPFRPDLWGDRALYQNSLKLSKAQAVGALVYALAGTVAGLLMVGLSLWTLKQEVGEYGMLVLFPLISATVRRIAGTANRCEDWHQRASSPRET